MAEPEEKSELLQEYKDVVLTRLKIAELATGADPPKNLGVIATGDKVSEDAAAATRKVIAAAEDSVAK